MKKIYQELRELRQLLNSDFELHTERLNAHTRTLRRHENYIQELRQDVERMSQTLGNMAATDVDLVAASEASEESFRAYRQRTEKVLDLLQVAAMTEGVESEARFFSLEERVAAIEKRFPAA